MAIDSKVQNLSEDQQYELAGQGYDLLQEEHGKNAGKVAEKMKKGSRFTLIELLVVIAIIGILAAKSQRLLKSKKESQP